MEATTATRHGVAVRPLDSVRMSGRLLRVAGDDRLVDLVRSGSDAAFEVVYERHYRGILSFCRHMLGSQPDAEDAVQHTFMAAYRALQDSGQPIQLRPWLYAIARNRCLSVIRARREQPVDELDGVATAGLAEQVSERQDLQELLHDLAGLPDDQRAALVLSELGALAHEDIAKVIGCPRQKVKALVFQARTSLQQSRLARETSCQEIRGLLSELRGGSLRRSQIRRHVRGCPGCREFEAEVKRQRKALAAVLPVLPTIGLKESVLGAVFAAKTGAVATGGIAAGIVGGAAATGGATATVAKVLVVAVAAGGGAAGVKTVADSRGTAGKPARSAPLVAPAALPASAPQPVVPVVAVADEPDEADRPVSRRKATKRAKKQRKAQLRARAKAERKAKANAPHRPRAKIVKGDKPKRKHGANKNKPKPEKAQTRARAKPKAPRARGGRGSQRAAENRADGRPQGDRDDDG